METQAQSLHDVWGAKIKELLTDLGDNLPDPYREHYTPENVEEVEHKPYPGFWPYTNGGYKLRLFVPVFYIIGTGYKVTQLGGKIDELDEAAHLHAEQIHGERTEQNENEFYETYDQYLQDVDVWIEIQVKLYNSDNYFSPHNGRECFRCDVYLELGDKNEALLQDYDTISEEKLTEAINNALNYLNQ
jgi:hypothetical protein